MRSTRAAPAPLATLLTSRDWVPACELPTDGIMESGRSGLATSHNADSGTLPHAMCVTRVDQLWLRTDLWIRPLGTKLL